MDRQRRPGRYPTAIRRQRPLQIEVPAERRRRPILRTGAAPLLLVAGFALVILIGTLLLSLPIASESGEWTSFPRALFVATSAVCVTGLTPVDTATYWSGFGEAVILVLIQIGGLGFMTSATLLFVIFGWRMGLRGRLFLSESLDMGAMGGAVRLVRRAAVFTAVVELIGFVLLTARFAANEPLDRAAWWGLFHSISAFNNAGFDVFGGFRSLEAHDDAFTLLTISGLIVLGGIGYFVVEDLWQRQPKGISVDSRIVLWMTGMLLALGFFLILILEWNQTLGGMSIGDKVLHSWFHSVTPRTAGFNSLPMAQMHDETLFSMQGLMFIGGGSGSTAGGIKIGTFAVLVIMMVSAIRGRSEAQAFGREVRRTDMDRALTVAILSVLFVFVAAVALARAEQATFLSIIFETTSAFGTVGLSIGLTPELSTPGLFIITIAMFVGRLGPLTMVLALTQRMRRSRLRLAEERVRIG